jgi:NTE family protein
VKTGIALGGGGAKGLAHIGALKALQRGGIVPDLVSGTSMGALVGGLYCLKGDIGAVEEFALGFENADLSPYLAARPSSSGLVSEKRIQAFLDGLFGGALIEELRTPFSCVAADVRSGGEVVIDRGPLARAVRASISVPVIFKPVHFQGRYLVDGGLVNPVPVDALKRGGAGLTVAVNVITPPGRRPPARKRGGRRRDRDKPLIARLDDFFSRTLLSGGPRKEPNLIETTLATIEIMQEKLVQARLANDCPDAAIHVDTAGFKMFEFYRPAELIRRGEEAAEQRLPAILRLRRKLAGG